MDNPSGQNSSEATAVSGRPISTAYSYYALIILTLLNLLNYIDRFIFATLIPYIEKDFHFTDEQFGLIGGAFTIVYTLLSPIYGYFADRRARTGLISSGIAIWSLATAAGGVAQSYWQLFVARAAVGIGEASFVTISPGFLSDYFDRRRRGLAFGVFFAAVPLGQAFGFILGGKLGDPSVLGWRHTLYVVGGPGLVMALIAHFLREPERGKFDKEENAGSLQKYEGSIIDGYKALAANSQYIVATLGYIAMAFALGIFSFWAPKLLVSDKGLAENIASQKLGIYVTVAGLIGTLLGGWLGDLFAKWVKNGYFFICAVSTLLSAPPAVVAIAAEKEDIFFPALFITVVLLFMSNGPVNAIIVNSVSSTLRSTAMATTILTMHFLGDALSVPLVGSFSTAIEQRIQAGLPLYGFLSPIANLLGITADKNLSLAMLIAPIALILSGLFFTIGIRLKDTAK